MKLLVVFGTLEGQTEKIAHYLSNIFQNRGYTVETQHGAKISDDFEIEEFDAVVVGVSIHMSKYPAYINKFANKYHQRLNTIPSAFFTVCMAIDSKRTVTHEEAKRYGEKFLAETGWRPKYIDTFAGAVKYTQYNFITRFIMKIIARREGGSTDTSRDHEYTDWEAVARFADRFMQELITTEYS